MTVTNVQNDPEKLTMALTAEFEATPERIWQLWADPRQLERWWGYPGFSTTMTKVELRPGGEIEFRFLTIEDLEMALKMDMDKGIAYSLGRIDGVLAEPVAVAGALR